MGDRLLALFDRAQPYIGAALLSLWVFVAPVKATLSAVFFMCLVDVVAGVWSARKQGLPITSYKLRQTIPKFLGYVVTILAVFVFQRVFASSLLLVNSVGGFICATELLSVAESMTIITGLPLLQKIKDILQPPKEPPK